jgi:preprotein translocase subunit SecD
MRIRYGLIAAVLALAAPAYAQTNCGEWLHLAVEPPEKAPDVEAVLRRRLEGAGAKPVTVERDGAGLKALLPQNLGEALLTRPGKFEMRLVAAGSEGLRLQRLDAGAPESVEPEVIVNEYRLREAKMSVDAKASDPRYVVTFDFRLDPVGMRNLLAASAEAVGRKLAVIVEDKIVVTPIIRAPIASAEGEVAGGFTEENTAFLAEAMRGGRLPARVTVAGREPATCGTN